jgi:hypothetical protein
MNTATAMKGITQMTKSTIDMAREAKMPYDFVTGEPINLEKLTAFEALVRADERKSFYGQDKPAECADGCPPNLVCDYCQVVAPAVQEPVAQAWDEGYRAGIDDERTSEASIGIAGFDAKVEPARNNPYRTTPPAAPVQEPVAMREALVKIASFLGVVRVYAQDIRPKHELETDKPLHWKARELQDEVIRMLDTTPPAQPAVPDAFGTREGEHPQYVQGWNDCRAEMLKGRHEPV